ncbi:MAG TPA: carboxypeptidase-like regulatory domain-containing protein, partial [Mucilaginibacter sp.]|nr:carboxypeptidase-like regulatory domain-containing protein [Mucilaginibacter sp.]
MKKTNISCSSYVMLLCYLFLSSSAWAKSAVLKEITLAEAFKEIARHYKVNFIYEDQTIAGKTLQDVNLFQGKSITTTLDRILPPLGLSWFNTDQQNYAVYPTPRTKSTAKSSSAPLHTALTDSLKGYISGYVKDEHDHAQSFATVSLIKVADSVVVSNVLTDTAGFYHFTDIQPGDYKIKVSMMAYQFIYSANLVVTGHQNIKVEILVMKPSTKTLSEVKVTASRPLVERKSDRFILNVENSPMASGNSFQLLR